MKAQVVQADKTIRIEDKPVPSVGDDEVLVRVIAVAQNPTDWKRKSSVSCFQPQVQLPPTQTSNT